MRPWRVLRPFHESKKGLQALSDQRWPPLGAFIKPPALRVVPDLRHGLARLQVLRARCGQDAVVTSNGIDTAGDIVGKAPPAVQMNAAVTERPILILAMRSPPYLGDPCSGGVLTLCGRAYRTPQRVWSHGTPRFPPLYGALSGVLV
jgi:hypothetical protein